MGKPHQYLVKYLDVLTGGSKSVRFFLPPCGKAGDLVYLYNEGHTVTGVEGVPFVVEQFFRDNRLCIYACDFFSVTPEMIGEVDAVYDRGALEAVNVGDRQGYVKLMQSLLGKDFRYVLNAYEYDDSEFQGPPRNLPRDEVFNLFENEIVEVLEEADFSEYGREKYNLGVTMLKII